MHLTISCDLSMTTMPAVPSPLFASIKESKSINIVSQTLFGNKGIEDPPGITA